MRVQTFNKMRVKIFNKMRVKTFRIKCYSKQFQECVVKHLNGKNEIMFMINIIM